jgi:hypothetical protein
MGQGKKESEIRSFFSDWNQHQKQGHKPGTNYVCVWFWFPPFIRSPCSGKEREKSAQQQQQSQQNKTTKKPNQTKIIAINRPCVENGVSRGTHIQDRARTMVKLAPSMLAAMVRAGIIMRVALAFLQPPAGVFFSFSPHPSLSLSFFRAFFYMSLITLMILAFAHV